MKKSLPPAKQKYRLQRLVGIHVPDQIQHTVGITPFVVIPAHDLDRGTHDAGAVTVHNGGVGIVSEIDGNQVVRRYNPDSSWQRRPGPC